MLAVLTCVFAQHDLRLVAVAAVICLVACVSAFGFQARAAAATGGLRWAWLSLTALVAGSGIWATHFLAMLAYEPTMRIAYDLSETLASLAAAVVGMGAGFHLLIARNREGELLRGGDLVGGVLTGASITVMHYMGIDAVRTAAQVEWSPAFVAASLVVAAFGGLAAFALRRRVAGPLGWALASGAFVLGIVGLHFTAMTAVTLLPDPARELSGDVMGRGGLALITSGLATVILTAGLSLAVMERLGRSGAFGSMRLAFDAMPAGLVFWDATDRVIAWNDAYATLMSDVGVKVEAGELRWRYIRAAEEAGWITDLPVDHSWADEIGNSQGGSREFILPDGRDLRIEVRRTADGGGVTVLTDISAEKRAAREMAAARDVAEAANRAKTEFLANISHEIRTPLNGVLGVAEVLERTELTGQQAKLVGVIRQSGALLNGLLGDLLDAARIEAGAAVLRPEPTDLGDLAASVHDLFAGRAEEKGLDLVLDIAPGADGYASCDGNRLRQVLGNLVSNAIKFTDAGEVRLSLSRDGERLRFAVSDTGPGIGEADKAVIFQRFGQADGSATRRHGGAGLGLSICDGYIRKMGGTLTCDSAPGHGAVFSFELELPALHQPASDEVLAGDAPLDAEVGGFDLSRFNVLVVDDNAVNRQVMELILDGAGIPHASVVDGSEAVDAMTTGDFDAVLMDIQMPVMDGLEATRRIRAWEQETHRPRAPIVIVSANGLKEHVDAGRAAGADAHINKPISAAALLTELEVQRQAFVRQAAVAA